MHNPSNDAQIATELAELALSEILGIPVRLVEAEPSKPQKANSKHCAKNCPKNMHAQAGNAYKDNKNYNNDIHAAIKSQACPKTADNNAANCKTRSSCVQVFDPEKMSRLERQAFHIANSPIDHVLYQNPATIVFWKDGTKTVARCDEYDKYDPQAGLALAICKKIMGNQEFHDTLEYFLPDEIAHPESIED